jgi:DNA-binding GntR family transcriptional regulator
VSSRQRVSAVVTAQEAALHLLQERIANGDLPPGTQIIQGALAAELGVSVVPLREALKTLAAEGQVAYVRNRGYFVAEFDVEELAEAYRIRALLEDEAIRCGVPRLHDHDLRAMADIVEEIDGQIRAEDVSGFSAASRRFHFTIFDAAGMPRLSNFIRILWETTEPNRSLYIADLRHCREINEQHREILEAVRRGDVEETVAQIGAHRDEAMARLTAFLSPALGPTSA